MEEEFDKIEDNSLVKKAGVFLSNKIDEQIKIEEPNCKVKELALRALQSNADKEENKIDEQDIDNAITRYRIKCEQDKLKLRTKLEKKVIKQEVKADVFVKKYNNAIKQYGYLYELETVHTVNFEGNPVTITRPKDFTISQFANRMKAFSKWYKNLGSTTQVLIKNTWKIAFWVGISVGAVYILYNIVKYLATSGILNI